MRQWLGESARPLINICNVASMIFAVRANVALYFEIRTRLAGMRPVRLSGVSAQFMLRP